MALRALQGPTGGGTPVGGTGTTNTIPRWTGPSTLGDSGLIDNGTAIYTTTRNVGIGTASPGYKLDVVSAEVRIGAPAPGANTFLYLGNGVTSAGPYGVGALQFSGQAHTAVFANSGYGAARASLGMVSAGVYTPALSADPSGNVGIGTASPGRKLEVLDATTGAGVVQGIRITGNASNYYDIGRDPVNGAFTIVGSQAGVPLITFLQGANERARIDSAGNFGIKQSSPSSWEPGMRDLVVGALDGSSYGITLASTTQTTLAFSNGTTGTQKYAGFVQYSPGTSRLDFGTGGAARVGVITTGLDVSTAGYGLKLPATPGNADTQTLDCYQEGTWAPTLAGFGGTNPTVTASYTRVGRLVTIAVQIDATGGNQYSMTLGTTTITTPAGMTASSICAVPVVDGGVANRGIASVWTTGIIYLPTVALTTASTFFVATYRV